jgi:hypothetical protein
VQAVGDGVFAVGDEVEQSSDFGEGERDEAPMGGWRRFRFGWLIGPVVVVVVLV